MEPMEELLHAFEGKLETIRKMIDEFDEAMDYASQCALQGFAEGLSFAIEETRNRLGGCAPARDDYAPERKDDA